MHISRRDLIAAASLTTAAVTVGVAAPAHAQDHGAAPNETSDAEVARSVELNGMVFPVFDEKQQLRNYLFINARMLAGPGKDIWKYRDQQHFIRDAILKASHKISLHAKGNFKKLDAKVAADVCMKAANAVLGEKDALVTMTFTQITSRT